MFVCINQSGVFCQFCHSFQRVSFNSSWRHLVHDSFANFIFIYFSCWNWLTPVLTNLSNNVPFMLCRVFSVPPIRSCASHTEVQAAWGSAESNPLQWWKFNFNIRVAAVETPFLLLRSRKSNWYEILYRRSEGISEETLSWIWVVPVHKELVYICS